MLNLPDLFCGCTCCVTEVHLSAVYLLWSPVQCQAMAASHLVM